MRDFHSTTDIVQAIAAQTVNTAGGAVNSGDIDLQGCNGAIVTVNFGANGGDTLSASNYFTVTIEHADDDGTGAADTYADCDSTDIIGATPASGVVITVDDAAEDAASYKVGYVGDKRFIKVTITPNGTLTNGNPVSSDVIKGGLSNAPA